VIAAPAAPDLRAGTFLCDTSVLVAASDTAHQHHANSLVIVTTARPDRAFCAAHTLAELYATLTATPPPRMRRTSDVLANVEHAGEMFTPIPLDVDDYRWVLRHAGATGVRSGQVHDALILRAAERAGVETVYTWNLPHFRRVAWPTIIGRIREP
jgi:predicted nucleic acid-binding protein